MLRAHEHDVLEEMRETRATGLLVRRSDVIPRVDGDDRRRVVLVQQHLQSVRERIALHRNRRHRLGAGGARQAGERGTHGRDREHPANSFHCILRSSRKTTGTLIDSPSTYRHSSPRFCEIGLVRVGDMIGRKPKRRARIDSRNM